MMKKLLSITLLLAIALTGLWCLVFKTYYDTDDEAASRLSLGNWPGALETLKAYQESVLSYPVYSLAVLEKFRLRLLYLEGVVAAGSGKPDAAAVAFRKVAASPEAPMAAAATYNLALYALQENMLQKAQVLFNDALMLDPDDIAAKINLELTLHKIVAREAAELPEETEKEEALRPQAEPGEQWRLEVPDEEGEGSGGTSGRSFL